MSKHKRKRSSRSRDRSDNGKRYRSDEEVSNKSVEKRLKVIENALFFLMDEAEAKKLAEIANNQKSSDPNKKDNDKLFAGRSKSILSEKILSYIRSKDTRLLHPEILLDRMGADPTSRTIQNRAFQCASRWNSWLAEGLSKEEKENILKQYSRNRSCHLEAPVIKEELVKAIPEATQNDMITQNDIGTALSALGSAISLLLDEDSAIDKFDLLRKFFDAGGLLTDPFHKHNKARKAYINPTF
ncbi:hypothetical protein TKK_0013310 [Trichogramma kaykai]